MAKFRYRMQNILDIQEKMENQAKTAYGMANAKLATEQQKLQDILIRRAGYESKARELVSGNLNVLEIRECRQAIDVMKSKQRSQMMNVHAAERNVELARKQLNEAMVERKTHEKLKEKAFEEFKQELLHEESKEIDELVSYTYHDNGQRS
jgi:flagellar FliJ protein